MVRLVGAAGVAAGFVVVGLVDAAGVAAGLVGAGLIGSVGAFVFCFVFLFFVLCGVFVSLFFGCAILGGIDLREEQSQLTQWKSVVESHPRCLLL